ncbi:Transposase (plasmid) [Shigella dysenteriae 1617]|uniref:Transposase n=1 Tax=Shigella dysenteriae 1617 TaxID=754093 RepID=A0A0A7A538_SHIDY|nr:Transposase [Shigella dysenteriae 1617]
MLRAQLAQRMKTSGNKPNKRRRRCDEAADAEVLARILDIISGLLVLGPEKRRRRTTQEKIAIVQQSFEPGMTVSDD